MIMMMRMMMPVNIDNKITIITHYDLAIAV